jgi:hypothetical protein
MPKQPIPTPAEAVRLVFKRACMTISREHALQATIELAASQQFDELAKSIDAPSPRVQAVSFVKARRARSGKL